MQSNELRDAVRGLLNFVYIKYKKDGEEFKFTCNHHRKLAALINWEPPK